MLNCNTDGGVINILVGCYKPLSISCAETVYRFAFISSITQLTVLLRKGSYIPEQCEGGVQVPVDLLCQQCCKLPAWLQSSIFLHGLSFLSLSICLLHFHIFTFIFFLQPPPAVSVAASLFLSFYLMLCHFWFISQQVFASLRISLERREH